MTWQGILGHDDIVDKLRHAVVHNRLASSFLFAGPAGIGKHSFALRFGQALLCEHAAERPMDPCGVCPSCVMALAGSHPDIMRVAKPEEKSELPLELLLGASERRGREGLCHDISLKPYFGGRKVAVIDDADYLNEEGANCLLKTLEEPPPRSVLILVGTSPARQLPTIRSRCQLLRFQPLSEEIVAHLLLARDIAKDAVEAQRLAAMSQGSLQRAVEMADPELWAWRSTFLEKLSERPLRSMALVQMVTPFVEQAGKDAAPRRMRLRQIVQFAVQHYRMAMTAEAGIQGEIRPLNDATPSEWPLGNGCDAPLACLDRCIEALRQIDRNANQSTLIEAWLDDLAATGG